MCDNLKTLNFLFGSKDSVWRRREAPQLHSEEEYCQVSCKEAAIWWTEDLPKWDFQRIVVLSTDRGYQYLSEAAELSHSKAMELTAMAYMFGDYLPQDLSSAKRLFDTLSSMGSPQGQMVGLNWELEGISKSRLGHVSRTWWVWDPVHGFEITWCCFCACCRAWVSFTPQV